MGEVLADAMLLPRDSLPSGFAFVIAALGAFLMHKLLLAVKDFYRINEALKGIPMAPGGDPIFGHAMVLATAPTRGYGAWNEMTKWMEQKGKIVRFRVLADQGIIVADPSALRRAFQQAYKVYGKDLELAYKQFLPILGTGLLTSDGALWQKQRTLIGPALRIEILDDVITIAKRATDRLSAKLEHLRGTGQAVNIEEEYRALTLQVIGDAVLSLDPEECDKAFTGTYAPIMEESNLRVLRPWRLYIPSMEWFRYRQRVHQLNQYLTGLIRDRWSKRQKEYNRRPADILDRILDSLAESKVRWSRAVETQLCYEIKTFLLAGHETTSTMLTWATYELSQNEEYRQKVLAEAVVAMGAGPAGEDAPPPPRAAVDGMTYTLSVLKEALRLYNLVPIVMRRPVADDELLGHTVPRGCTVVLHLTVAHMQGWRDPKRYMPDRFMPGGEYDQFDDDIRPYKFVPFIQGPRNCLGQHFSLLEARVVLGLLTQRFRFTPVHPDAGAQHETIIPVSPKHGMEVTVD